MIRILKRLFRLMSHYKGRLYLGIALSMISNILGIVPIICGVWTIKLILDHSNGAAVLEPVYVLQLTTIILGSVLLRWLFAYIRATRQDSIAHETTCAERLKIGDILKRVSLGFLQRKNMGEFTTAITTDLAFFEMQTMNVVNNIIDSYIFLAITIIWLLCFSPFLGGAALLAVAISTAGLQLIERQSRKNSPIRQESINEMADEIVQYVRGMAVVKSFKQEGVASDGLYRAYHKSKEINIKMERNFAPCDALHRLGLYMGTMAITCITALLALQREMELYMAIMLIVYSYVMFNTIESANNSLHILEILDTVAEKLQSIEDAELIDKDGKDVSINQYDIEFMLKNAPIVILDEATASIDPENEHLIQQAIGNLTHGKTIIVIAHRLATIESADQILVIDEGKVVQRGTHQQLVSQNGLYKRFISIREQAEGWAIG